MVKTIDIEAGEILRRDFASEDCANYMKMLAPYKKKVYAQASVLLPSEIEKLNSIKKEICDRYARRKGANVVLGDICNIIYYSQILRQSKKEEELDREYRRLCSELQEKEKQGIALEERSSFLRRIDEIKYLLDPFHYQRANH
jgi:hypothetical protein